MTKGRGRVTIAICYDFDGTLIPGNMQENSFLPDVGMSPGAFWTLVKEEARLHDMDEVLAYMQLMMEKAREGGRRFTREALRSHGKELELFPGVEGWFDAVSEYCKGVGATVEHYVISSGLKEMIEGCSIAKSFTHIFASGFSYDANDVPKFAARSVNYTTKTQYLFRINKGILDSWSNDRINRFTPEEERPRPFSRMIYIGDGETDVPAMKMMNYQGGYSIAVYPPKMKGKRRNSAAMRKMDAAKQLVADNRAKFATEANFGVDGPVYEIVTRLIRRIADEYALGMNLTAV